MRRATSYDQCSKCRRLIPQYHPEAHASACPPLFTYIDGNKVCWQCTDERIVSLGVVPFPETTEDADTRRALDVLDRAFKR